MKPSIVLLCIGVLICSVNTRIILPNEDDDDNIGDLNVLVDNDGKIYFLNEEPPEIKNIRVHEDDVIFCYLSRNTPLTELLISNVDDIGETDFDPSRKTMFIIHGWNNNKNDKLNTMISAALLEADDWNVFIVDWGKKAKNLYMFALGSVPGVGDITAKFITLLQEKTGLQMSNTNLCGHSLGAHVCGRAGSVLNGKVNSIVGMDPALPFISANNINKRLDASDAEYVQVIHTTGGYLGFLEPIGHSDFYPNGGKRQRGCGLDPFGSCRHTRSYLYFTESITNNNFKARFCESRRDWKKGNCDNNQVAYMGGNNLERVNGTFYLNTARRQPFSLG